MRRLTAAGMVLAWVCAGGCLFTPRVAESPAGQVIDYLPQANPINVLENLQTAMNNTDAAGYDRMIAEDFTYVPDPDTESSYPGVDWSTWNREKEIAFITDFFNNVQGIQANLREVAVFTDWSGTEAELRYIYRVDVQESGGVVPYRASVTFNLRLDGTYWVLTRWLDEQGEQDPDTGAQLPSLGQRRGAFASAGGG